MSDFSYVAELIQLWPNLGGTVAFARKEMGIIPRPRESSETASAELNDD